MRTTMGAEQFFNKIIARDAAFDEQVRRVMPDEGVAGMPQHIEIDDRFVIKRKPIESETRADETGSPVTKIPIGDLDESTEYPTSLRSSKRSRGCP
ncbi:hypothetical protein ACCT07_36440 [Rhizobium johnstonii]|uniref:hypothetical protein n=1 Tax=Rhizobium johnstonii TaxID=3019933 RepID=UPI003F96D5F4